MFKKLKMYLEFLQNTEEQIFAIDSYGPSKKSVFYASKDKDSKLKKRIHRAISGEKSITK